MRSSLRHLFHPLAALLVGAFLCACSSSSPSSDQDAGPADAGGGQDSGKDCSASETAIKDAATRRGLDPDTVCSSSDAAIMKDFAAACAELQACEAK
jgi:hypothetical protein